MKGLVLSIAAALAATAAGCGSGGSDKVVVPNLSGMSASAAEAKLTSLGVNPAWTVTPLESKYCIVTSQRERAVSSSGAVHLTCKVTVPSLVGKTYDKAHAKLQSVGLSDSYPRSVIDTSRCTVTTQSRRGRVPPKAAIKLGLKCPPSNPPPSAPSSSSGGAPSSNGPDQSPPSSSGESAPPSSGSSAGSGHPGVCKDGSPTNAAGRPGACSHHGGLAG